MTASLILLLAAMSVMSGASRLKLTPRFGIIPQYMTGPTTYQGIMIPTPVNVQRLQIQPSITTEFAANANGIVFPATSSPVMHSSVFQPLQIQHSITPKLWLSASRSLFPTGDNISTWALASNINETWISRKLSPPDIFYDIDEGQLLDGLAVRNYQQTPSTELLDSSTESGRAVPSTGINTVESLELNSFLGRWYQMYRPISSENLPFGNAGLISDYSLNAGGGTVSVLKKGFGPDGEVTEVWGRAKATGLPGQWKIYFNKFMWGNKIVDHPPDTERDYWIYKLGPVKNDKYQYATVGGRLTRELGRDQTQLFVLARDPKDLDNKYDKEVREWLTQNGFDLPGLRVAKSSQ